MENALNELRTDARGGSGVASQNQHQTEPSVSRFTGRRVHFIGIGGSGMNGLARMLLDIGAVVTGSEPKPNAQTIELTKHGAQISRGQMGELLNRDIDLVVRTAAVKDTNPEFQAAGRYGLRTIKYAELLGQVMQERLGVAIAGTHGKSTTTAMTAYALLRCGGDPSFVVGGTVPQLGGGSRSGKGRAFIAEACEFDRSFHNLRPRIAAITNIEADHLDCYKDLDEIIESFRRFASLVPADGLILANATDTRVRKALAGLITPVQGIAVGEQADWSATVTGIDKGCYRGDVRFRGKPSGQLKLSVAGEHNLFDAVMAVAASAACGIDPAHAAEALGDFGGVDRRMMEVGEFNDAIIVDDYGHHPTEVRTTLRALRQKYDPKRLICVFQPHQHSRTRFLLDEFAGSFTDAEQTVITDIYFVRDSEAERQRVSATDLVARIKRNGQRAVHIPTFEQIVEYLKNDLRRGDLLVTMGAGNVWEIGRDLAQQGVI
jgi:UDP-N-acetylmuramate--alanine ligase